MPSTRERLPNDFVVHGAPLSTVDDYLALRVYGRRPRELEDLGIAIAWTNCHLGGGRPWMICPECGRRVGVLYHLFGPYACRRCLKLAYPSNRERPFQRTIRRARKMRLRLGGSANLLDPRPKKPSRMRWAVFLRMRRDLDAAEQQLATLLDARLRGRP